MSHEHLKVLVAYSMGHTHVPAINDYLISYSRFLGASVQYIHVTEDAVIDANLGQYDVVINNFCARHCFKGYVGQSFSDALRNYQGVKILVVQDEYNRTNTLQAAIRDLGFDVVLTCVPNGSVEYVYPLREFPGVKFESVLTGYVSDQHSEQVADRTPIAQRPIIIGYRGRQLPAYYGRLGFEKYEIGRRMREFCQARSIPHNIAMSEQSRIYGAAWFRFIASCRAMLGTESGSNVFDFDGSLEQTYEAMTARNGGQAPTYDEFAPYIEQRDDEVSMAQISPRVFECAAMRTPMILFRGFYSGLVEPNLHYIVLEKDFSNIDDVFGRLQDVGELEALAERAYDHIVGSDAFSYRAHMWRIREIIAAALAKKRKSGLASLPLRQDCKPVPQPASQPGNPWVEAPSSMPGTSAQWALKEREKVIWQSINLCDELEETVKQPSGTLRDDGDSVEFAASITKCRSYLIALKSRMADWYETVQSIEKRVCGDIALPDMLRDRALLDLEHSRLQVEVQSAAVEVVALSHLRSCKHIEQDIEPIQSYFPDADRLATLRHRVADFHSQLRSLMTKCEELKFARREATGSVAVEGINRIIDSYREELGRLARDSDGFVTTRTMLTTEHKSVMELAAAEQVRQALAGQIDVCSYIEADLEAALSGFSDAGRLAALRQLVEKFRAQIGALEAMCDEIRTALSESLDLSTIDSNAHFTVRCSDRQLQLDRDYRCLEEMRTSLLTEYLAVSELVAAEKLRKVLDGHLGVCTYIEADVESVLSDFSDADRLTTLRQSMEEFRAQIVALAASSDKAGVAESEPPDLSTAESIANLTERRSDWQLQLDRDQRCLEEMRTSLLTEYHAVSELGAAEKLRKVLDGHLGVCTYIEADLESVLSDFSDADRLTTLRQSMEEFRAQIVALAASSDKAGVAESEPPDLSTVESIANLTERLSDWPRQFDRGCERLDEIRAPLLEEYRTVSELAAAEKLQSPTRGPWASLKQRIFS